MNLIKKIIFIVILIIVWWFQVYANEAMVNSESILEKYYSASSSNDIDSVMSVLDKSFYSEIVPEWFTYEQYLKEFYDNFLIIDYNIFNSSKIEWDGFDLIFYNLKAKWKEVESWEIVDTDNDMVALLVKDWKTYKLAWTILHELYEYKLLANWINDVVISMTIDDLDKLNLKDYFKDKWLLWLENESIMDVDNSDGLYSEKETNVTVNDLDNEKNNNIDYSSKNNISNIIENLSWETWWKFSKEWYEEWQKRFYEDKNDSFEIDYALVWKILLVLVFIFLWFIFLKKRNDKK